MGRAFYPHQLPSLIQTIFSSQSEGDIIRCLHEDNAQTFVDVIDQASSTSAPHHGAGLIEIHICTFF